MLGGVDEVVHFPRIALRIVELLGGAFFRGELPLLGLPWAGLFELVEVVRDRQVFTVGVADEVGQVGDVVAGVAVSAVGDGSGTVVDGVEAVGIGVGVAVSIIVAIGGELA